MVVVVVVVVLKGVGLQHTRKLCCLHLMYTYLASLIYISVVVVGVGGGGFKGCGFATYS